VKDLGEIARRVVEQHQAAPSACVAAAIRHEGAWHLGIGAFGRLGPKTAGNEGVTPATPYDLASLTKPVTALTLARLERAGSIRRALPLGQVLPELATSRSARVPLDLLAAHRGGLDAHRPLYAPLESGTPVDPAAALATAADARRAECAGDPPPEGFPPVYSDLGYLLLGAALARCAGRASPDVEVEMEREVLLPLGLSLGSARSWRARDPGFDARVAPTEDVAWRGGVVRGAVHDENAWAITGSGAAGHAGLFGDALDVARLGAAILDALAGRRPDWLTPEDMAPLVRPRPGGSHLAGFDSKSGEAPTCGRLFGPRTFGHLGFTGTSLWMDPDAELVGVLLTNRVHPTRAWVAGIRSARPATYDAIAEAMRS